MANFEVKILGVREARENAVSAIKEMFKKAEDNMFDEGKRLLGQMVEITPERSGKLKRSGKVTHRYRGRTNSFTLDYIGAKESATVISFGNANVDYAIPVHEKIRAKHAKGRSKFMESVVQKEKDNVPKNLAKGIS